MIFFCPHEPFFWTPSSCFALFRLRCITIYNSAVAASSCRRCGFFSGNFYARTRTWVSAFIERRAVVNAVVCTVELLHERVREKNQRYEGALNNGRNRPRSGEKKEKKSNRTSEKNTLYFLYTTRVYVTTHHSIDHPECNTNYCVVVHTYIRGSDVLSTRGCCFPYSFFLPLSSLHTPRLPTRRFRHHVRRRRTILSRLERWRPKK